MSKEAEAYQRGLKAGKEAKSNLHKEMDVNLQWTRRNYPASRHLDYLGEVIKLDRERMQNRPNLRKYPETNGLPDLLIAERKGFLEGCDGGERELAFHYTWSFFVSRRLNTRYIGSAAGADRCTAVFIRDSKEGGPLSGQNIDNYRCPELEDWIKPPQKGPDGKWKLLIGGASSAVLCDEEPQEMFPVDVWAILPTDCKKIADIVEFLRRYSDFWGPGNFILADEELNAVALEKSNCRLGARFSQDGTAAVTACSYLIPEMKTFKEERSRRSLEIRGWDETCLDWVYWKGCDARYRRLLKLTEEASRRGATLDDMGQILTDHAVPFPDRICLAGERCLPTLTDTDTNWTLTSEARVLKGPNRRTLFWRVEGNTPCYKNPPFLVPGAGVKIKPEWQKGTRPIQDCTAH